MNLLEYRQFYAIDEGHWYISKVKQYSSNAIQEFARGLFLFSRLLGSQPDFDLLEKYKSFCTTSQLGLFSPKHSRVPVNRQSALFLSLKILAEDLVNMSHLRAANIKKYETFLELRKEYALGKSCEYFLTKYGRSFLDGELTIYFRNFFSWLSKFGFIGMNENDKYCFITEVGYEFIKSHHDPELSNAIFLNQIKKIQVWNPTIATKYQDIRVIPYYLILQVLMELKGNYFSKDEYVLFITKIKSHSRKDINLAGSLINEYRSLSQEEKVNYIKSINKVDRRLFPDRRRTNYERLKDSYGKEISAYAFSNKTIIGDGEWSGTVRLANKDSIEKELNLFNQSPQYIEFVSKYDWIRHLGSLNGLSVEDLVEVYIRSGKNADDIISILKGVGENLEEQIENKLLEKEVEEYYEQNLSELDETLEIVKEPNYGRQFPTHIGSIDLLCKRAKSGEFVVVEFKRGQVSDETIGQILRYMGWVYIHMSESSKRVYGIIVGRDFNDKIDYSITGVQSDHIFSLLQTKEHPFSPENRPVLNPKT